MNVYKRWSTVGDKIHHLLYFHFRFKNERNLEYDLTPFCLSFVQLLVFTESTTIHETSSCFGPCLPPPTTSLWYKASYQSLPYNFHRVRHGLPLREGTTRLPNLDSGGRAERGRKRREGRRQVRKRQKEFYIRNLTYIVLWVTPVLWTVFTSKGPERVLGL